jgi:beta-lactamase class A
LDRRSSVTFRLVLRWFSFSLLLAAALLTALKYREYQNLRTVFPAGSRLGGLPAGGLDAQLARQRLEEAYSRPVAADYGEDNFFLEPALAGFELNMEGMLAAAEGASRYAPGLQGFADYLFARPVPPFDIPLQASISEERLQAYLAEEIASRYDRPAVPALPYPGTVNFSPGGEGLLLDVEKAVPRVAEALRSIEDRTVHLPIRTVVPPGPSFENLEIMLRQNLVLSGFEGTAALFLLDLQNGREIYFAYRQGEELPIPPDVAYTGASIIKIPIMVSVFRRLEANPDPETDRLLEAMIAESGNESADWVMERIIDPEAAPLKVTSDMQALGLENTFLAGYFRLGAPLLDIYETPANRRVDAGIDPDIYNQTTAAETGRLLEAITTCSRTGGGRLVEVFGDEITQAECQAMLVYLESNKTPYLIEAGVPESVQVIHKHGWVSLFGVINTIGDAALVSSPGGDYILVVYLYHEDLLLWEPASSLVSSLSQAIYNYFNFQ